MLAWRTQSGGIPVVPACLADFEAREDVALVHRETSGGHIVGVGDPLIWADPRKWEQVGDGWSVALLPGQFEPRYLARVQGWVDVVEVKDMHGRAWFAPQIRRQGGGRAFRVSYGRDWLPALTPDQTRAELIVASAINASEQDTPMSVACQWAAELLSLTHHITPEALAAIAVLDDTLAVEVIRVATGLEVEAPTHGV